MLVAPRSRDWIARGARMALAARRPPTHSPAAVVRVSCVPHPSRSLSIRVSLSLPLSRAFSSDSASAPGSSSQNAGSSGSNAAGQQSSAHPHAPKATVPPPWSAPSRRDVPPLPLDRIAGEGIGTLFEVRPDPIAVTPFQKAKLKATWGVRYALFAAVSGVMVLCASVVAAYYVYNPEAEIRARTMRLLRADPLVHKLIGRDVKDMSTALMRPRDLMAWHAFPWLPFLSHPVSLQFVVQGKKSRAQILVQWQLHPKWHKDPNAQDNAKANSSDKNESKHPRKPGKHKPLTDNHRWECLYLSMESRGQGQIVLQDNRATVGHAVETPKHKIKEA